MLMIGPRRFVLYTRPRSGSTLLKTMLHSHPSIACDGEIFGENVENPIYHFRQSVKNMVRKRPHIQWSGFKLFHGHVQSQHLENWFNKYVVVFLWRSNLFEQYVSTKLTSTHAAKNQIYHMPIHIDASDLLRQLHYAEQVYVEIKLQLRDTRHLEIYYETLLTEGYRKCVDFFGLHHNVPTISTIKQRTVAFETLILNYRDVLSALRGTKWEHMVERVA